MAPTSRLSAVLASALLALSTAACVGSVENGPPRDLPGDGNGDGSGDGNGDGSGGGGDDVQVIGTVELGDDPVPFDLSLGTDDLRDITVTSIDGYTGDVAFDLSGAPESWELTIEPSVVTLGAGETATATLSLAIPSDAEAPEDEVTLEVVATPLEEARDPSLVNTTTAILDNTYYLAIADGVGNDTDHGFEPVDIRLGAAIEFLSLDTTAVHRIHSNHDGVGFPHQGPTLDESNYRVTIEASGIYTQWYCHEHSATNGSGMITVVDPAE